jgi:hypothetical protein
VTLPLSGIGSCTLRVTAVREPPRPEGRGFPLHRPLPLQQRAFEVLRSLDGQDRALHPAACLSTDTVARLRATALDRSEVRAFHPLPERRGLPVRLGNTIEFEHLMKIPRAKSMDYVVF